MKFILDIDAAEFLEDSPYMLQELLRSAISKVLKSSPYSEDVNGYEFGLEESDEELLAKAHNETMFDSSEKRLLESQEDYDLFEALLAEEEADDLREVWNDDYLEPCESCGFDFDAGVNQCPNCEKLRA